MGQVPEIKWIGLDWIGYYFAIHYSHRIINLAFNLNISRNAVITIDISAMFLSYHINLAISDIS